MIKNIIFDFGDIFINLDKEATVNSMKKFGFKSITDEMNTTNQQYEKGLISTDEFVNFYHNLFPNASKEELIQSWNAIILDFPEHRLNFIESLKKENYRLFLLSNTNELHIDKVIENTKPERYNRFKDCFEVFYLSHEIQQRKPEKACYEYVLKENDLKAIETLFIDDSPENTIAASQLGIKTWNLNPGVEDVVQLFNKKNLFN